VSGSLSSYPAVKAALASGRDIGRLYVVWGDPYLCVRLIAAVRARLFPGGSFEDLDLVRLDASACGPADILAASRTAPFLAPRRMVLVEGVRAFRASGRGSRGETGEDLDAAAVSSDASGRGAATGSGGAAEASDWERLVAGIRSSACVVLRLDGPPDARLRLTKKAAGAGTLADCTTAGRDGASSGGGFDLPLLRHGTDWKPGSAERQGTRRLRRSGTVLASRRSARRRFGRSSRFRWLGEG